MGVLRPRSQSSRPAAKHGRRVPYADRRCRQRMRLLRLRSGEGIEASSRRSARSTTRGVRERAMTCSVLVVGMPSPAGCASTKTWKAAAAFVEQRLTERFGPAVAFEYAELFSPDMARHPDHHAHGSVPY